MPDVRDKDILMSLNRLLAANDRLAEALNGTERQWPYVSNCWIDQLSEPTPLLAKHRVKRCGTGVSGSGSAPSGVEISALSAST